MPHYECSGPVEVDIDVAVGFAEVTAAGDGEVVVTVTPTVAGRPGDVSLAAATDVSFTAGRLRVRVPRRLNLFGQSDSVDVHVQAPAASRVALTSSSGSFRGRGHLGDVRIEAKHGNVTLDTVADLTLDSRHGAVEVAEVTGRADVTAGHGHVRIERVGGDTTVRAAHGVVEFGTTCGSVDVTTSGPLTVDRALGGVRARSAHGTLRVREAVGGAVHLQNSYGGVEVGVPAGTAAWIDAASTHGAVRNELTPDPGAASSERAVELHLRADWADVVVRRSRPAVPVG